MNSNILSTRRLALLSAGVSLFGAATAFGVGGPITISNSPALSLGASGLTQGLVGTIWHVLPNDGAGSGQYGLPAAANPTLVDATNMETYISTGSYTDSSTGVKYTLPAPSETFLNTKDTFSYVSPYAEASFVPTSNFLGADAAGAAAVDQSAWTNSIIDQMGYIKIASAGTYSFSLANGDDVATVFVGGTGITPSGNAGSGTQLVAASYDNTKIPTSNYTASVTFGSAGYYPIEIMNYQEGGGAGMNLSVTAPSGGTAPTYWTTSALAGSVTPTPPPPVASAPPTPTDEWNFAKSAITGSTVSDIGSAGTSATAGTVIGTAASVSGGQLVVTSNNSGNGMTVPGSTFTNYTGSFTVAATFTRNANDPTANWGSVFALGTQKNPGAGFILFQPHRDDGSGYAAFYIQPAAGPSGGNAPGATGVINANGKPIPTGSLTQEVMVYDASTNQSMLYYNGVLQETAYVQLPAGVTSFDLAQYANYGGLGGIDPFNDSSMMGSYNDLSTWNQMLSANQVAGLYSSLTAVPEPGDLALLALGAMGLLLVSRRKSIRCEGNDAL